MTGILSDPTVGKLRGQREEAFLINQRADQRQRDATPPMPRIKASSPRVPIYAMLARPHVGLNMTRKAVSNRKQRITLAKVWRDEA